MSDDDSSSAKPAEPAWLKKLASLGATATAKQQRDARFRGSSGAASAGRSVSSWACACGWTGTVKEIKADPATGALACPACGATKGLAAQPG